jgi:hypothetical protein
MAAQWVGQKADRRGWKLAAKLVVPKVALKGWLAMMLAAARAGLKAVQRAKRSGA